ncbi:ROK family protein [Cellulomonas sp. PhB143]|uniref:ROK family protein n=1 Tax=Cellulomonas sp. PhB143 TaxID=2485186 RepID=UPI000F48E269|nr:ROK family protein [Cellulomonas sp. PhB143]ROS76808.1 polyphosphate glucokinase [Cellulomonas sp. PhB143]
MSEDHAPHGTRTLSVDCGGGSIKANVLDASGTAHASAVRVPTPYPLPPDRLVETIAGVAQTLPDADRVTVGMPGMIRHGVVVHTPHYVTRSGPRSRVDPALAAAWASFDVRAALEARLARPTIVLNDAEVHGAGVVAGSGLELVLTLGTGLGSALFDGGRVAPHLEWSHAPLRRGTTYDEYVGDIERHRLGNGLWSRRVVTVVEGLRPVFHWDRVYVGGGNSRAITPSALERLGDDVVVVPNSAALVGGSRAWELRTS